MGREEKVLPAGLGKARPAVPGFTAVGLQKVIEPVLQSATVPILG